MHILYHVLFSHLHFFDISSDIVKILWGTVSFNNGTLDILLRLFITISLQASKINSHQMVCDYFSFAISLKILLKHKRDLSEF